MRLPASLMVMILIVALSSAEAIAQSTPPSDPPATPATDTPGDESKSAEKTSEKPDDAEAPPSLDELLGIEGESDETPATEIADQAVEEELDRRLNAEELGNAFAEALSKMAVSADLLDRKFDTGLGTQRVQEDILSRLDALIEEAQRQQSSGGSSASSSSSNQQRNQQPGRQDRQQQGGQRNQRASDSREGAPPPRRDGEMNTVLEETGTEWGNLPERIREMLLQGRREKFSSLYEQLTRDYYRRLAEEGSS
jgi:hypothetical protein